MNVPSRAEWGEIDPDDLDANSALKTFLNKSFAEAQAMFAENALYFQEDLQSMPAAAFNYYAPALIAYLTSDRAKGDSDGASSFLHMLIWMLKSKSDVVMSETREILISAAEHISENQVYFDAETSIYGSFTDLLAEIRKLNEHRGA